MENQGREREQQRQENQKKKEYLNGYLEAKRREQMIQEQIQQLRADEMFPALQCDDMPRGTDKSDLSDYAAEWDELMTKLKDERLEAVRQYSKIYSDIQKVKNEREREVLTLRYLRGMKWEEVCMEMGLSWKWTHKIHADALKNFKST